MSVRLLQNLTAAAGATALAIGGLTLPLLNASAATSTIELAAPVPVTVGDSHYYGVLGNTGVPGSGQATDYPMAGTVTGRPGVVTHLQVMLILAGVDRADDLDIVLVAPDGRKVVLMSDVGGGAINTGVNFDDDAAAYVPDDAAPSSLWNRPSVAEPGDVIPGVGAVAGVSLKDLEGISPNGTWKLYVYDDSAAVADPGQVAWQLDLHTDGATSPSPSTIQVGGLSGVVTDVDVTLRDLRHHSLNNLDVMLVGPDGRRAMLLSDVGSNEVGTVDLTFDDEAAGPVEDMPGAGSYRPTDVDVEAWPWSVDRFGVQPDDNGDVPASLGTFDGLDPNGDWSLYVVDDAVESYVGALDEGWSLRLTTQPAAVPTTTATTQADTASPRVVARKPGVKAGSVRRGADVRARFSEQVRPASLTGSTVWLKAQGSSRTVRARVHYDAATMTVALDPRRRLAAHTTYRFVVTTRVLDLAGNRLDQRPTQLGHQRYVSRFRTA